ncbi:Hsp20/alpha crystallin family protein [Bacteroidia bacterium]|nr:Hsp20/alpha crystallin family protein [Bacteroidia bacterium]MDB9882440.1 Hsp20/alpha crystallin family protein [Bacteroidia bacterium]MDC1395427.1 Hsp20/alpha crystallin family protein [Bacteroidia bacterium]
MNTKTHPSLLSDILVSNFGGIVNDTFREDLSSTTANFKPQMELNEFELNYQVDLAIPGINKEDISITQGNDILTISGNRKHAENDGKTLISEIKYGSFKRAIKLPKNIEAKSINASYINGILTISIAKQEVPKPINIEIK